MEVITGVERRRCWRPEEKLRIVAESEQPDASVSDVGRRHEMSRGLLWTWRRQVRTGTLAPAAPSVFVPVRIAPEVNLGAPAALPHGGIADADGSAGSRGRIEIALPDGTCVRVDEDIGTAALRRVMSVLRDDAAAVRRAGVAGGWDTDMRRGMNGLALQVQQALQRDPHAGDLYVFRGKRGDLVKILWHDGLGMSLYAKRLERGRFIWPSPADGVVSITPAQLGYMLEGIDWRHPQRTWRPELAG